MPSHSVSTLSRTFGFACLVAAAPVSAWAAPGDIFVSRCCEADEIYRVSAGGSVTIFATSGLSGASALAFDAAGNLFVANSSNNTIERFARNGMGTTFAGTGLNRPTGLAFDASGNLFVANDGDNTIEKFTPNGVGTVFASSVFSGPFFVPASLAFDAKGNLFVGDVVETIVQFTPSGMESPFTTVPAEVEGLAFDSAGDLLVANGGGASVFAVAPNGDQRTIATGLPIATGLAVEPVASPVPEPATALIFAIAVAGLGLTRQRIIGIFYRTDAAVGAIDAAVALVAWWTLKPWAISRIASPFSLAAEGFLLLVRNKVRLAAHFAVPRDDIIRYGNLLRRAFPCRGIRSGILRRIQCLPNHRPTIIHRPIFALQQQEGRVSSTTRCDH